MELRSGRTLTGQKRKLLELALKVPYVNAQHNKVTRNDSSMSSLIQYKLSQSQCIRIGNALEKILHYWIEHEQDVPWNRLATPVKKNEHQQDILMVHKNNQEVIYAEIKANIELDTEKVSKTIMKVRNVHHILGAKHPTCKVHSFLISGRYLTYDDIPQDLVRRYASLYDEGIHLLGINDFLSRVGISYQFSGYEEYRHFWTGIAKHMFFRSIATQNKNKQPRHNT